MAKYFRKNDDLILFQFNMKKLNIACSSKSLKIMKNAFYFTSKTFFILNIFKFLS